MMNAEEKIYESFLKSRQEKLYFNQLKENTKLSNSSLQNALDKLIKKGYLKINKTKANTFFQIKNKKLFSLKFAEIAANKFENLNFEIKSPLRDFLKGIPNDVFTVVLFGSASRKEEKKGSDIDLLIVTEGKKDLEPLRKKTNNISNYPISIFQCSIQEFFDTSDHAVIQAKKTGFPIFREQNFYEAILNEY